MRSSTRTAAVTASTTSPRIWFCSILFFALATVMASAQTDITATTPTTTVQYLGQPNPQNVQSPITAPLGGIILKGSAINPTTGQPYRHLWVDDATFGICRIDPDIDSLGPYAINQNTCPFKINGASVTGGPMSFDPGRNFLYFVDEQRASQGIMRIGFLPDGDSGHGLLDFNSLFIMGGNTTGSKFGGGTTGCALPGNPGLPSAAALSPLGDLWVGFKKSGTILRFNSPGTATQDGFGTCTSFIQTVGTVNKITNGLAWIGHDLWGADGTSPFFIKNADTTCLVSPHGTCSAGTGEVVNVLTAAPIGALATAVMSDQYFPATNGNNVYFTIAPAGGPDDVAWLGNASAASASMVGTTIDNDFLGTITPPPNEPLINFNGVAVDQTDPANVVAYSGDDYSGTGALASGQWFQSCQGQPPAIVPAPAPSPYVLNCPTPTATAAPGVPLNVVAVAGESDATVSWSPAQVNQPVTSYTVRNSFAQNADGSAAPTVADVVVNPVAGSNFPPTSTLITGLTDNITYGFEVSASNAAGTSAFSAESNHVTPPGLQVPTAPTNVAASAGDTQAFVTWTVSTSPVGQPITSYTVTALVGGVSAGITVTVPPPSSTSNTGSAVIGGLTNGVTYTFEVHATNIAGNSPESAPSNAVTPSAANIPTLSISISGPASVTSTPVQITYGVTVTNTSNFPATNVSVTHTLSTIPANITATGAVRDSSGNVTITTSSAHFLSIGQSVTVAGVGDPSFNGTFTISNVPDSLTFNYSEAGFAASNSGGGTATGQPTANIMVAQPGQGSCTGGGTGIVSVTCSLGNLDPGASVLINVIVQMQSQAIINSATASGNDLAGTVLANVTTSLTTSPPAPVTTTTTTTTDLQLSGSAKNGGPTVTGTLPTGAPDTYNWQIRDATSVPANNVVFTQTMPAALVFESVTTDLPIDLGSCTGPAPGTAGGTVTCTAANLNGNRKNGAKPVQQFNVAVNVNVVQTGTIKTTGSVTFNGTDTNPSNNTVVVTINAK